MDSTKFVLKRLDELEREAAALLLKISQEENETEKKIVQLLHGQNELKRMLIIVTTAINAGRKV